MIEAYPLTWPPGYPRSTTQKHSRFKTTLGRARDEVSAEIQRLRATNLIISTDVPLKQNGELRADWTKYTLDDTGAAVYFTINDKQVCLCCDTYKKVWENLYAIARTMAALRQIDRDGVSDFLNRAFTGFTAIPERAGGKSCWDVLGIQQTKDAVRIRERYRHLAKHVHPDSGGDAASFTELKMAEIEALKYAES